MTQSEYALDAVRCNAGVKKDSTSIFHGPATGYESPTVRRTPGFGRSQESANGVLSPGPSAYVA